MRGNLAALLAVVMATRAAIGQSDTLRIGLRDAADLGRQRSPVSLGARAAVAAARARVDTTRSALLPHVSLQATHITESFSRQALGLAAPNLPPPMLPPVLGPFQDQDARPTAKLTLFDAGSIERLRAAHSTASAADFAAQATGDDDADTAARAYVELAAARSLVLVRTRLAQLADTLLAQSRERFQANLVPEIDVTRAQAESIDAASGVTRIASARDQAQTRLLRVIEQPMTRPVALTDTLAVASTDIDQSDDSVVASALTRRPELRADEARLAASRRAEQAARDAWLPMLQASGDFGWNGRWLLPNERDNPIVKTQTLTVGAIWDVFDGGRREGVIQLSHQETRQATLALREREERIENEARSAVVAFRAQRVLVADAERRMALAERELRDIDARYRRGLSGSIDLIDAQHRYVSASEGMVTARRDYALARVALLHAAGRLDAL